MFFSFAKYNMSLKRSRDSDDEDLVKKEDANGEKIARVDLTDRPKSKLNSKSESKDIEAKAITCTLPPICSNSPKTFLNFQEYELHYISDHTNVCSECSKNFPSSKLLDLHINENHNPFIKIKLQKEEPVFGCFVENCEKLFKNHKKRRLHLIDKHHYPKDYLFSIVDRGIKKSDTSLIKKNVNKQYGIWKPA